MKKLKQIMHREIKFPKHLGIILILLFLSPYVFIALDTQGRIWEINHMEGTVIHADSLSQKIWFKSVPLDRISTDYKNDIEIFINDNTLILRVIGEGIPYFAGYIVYDTLQQKVLYSRAQSMWW